MSLEELLKQKKLLKKDYRDETPEEREARIRVVEEYQAANPEAGAEEGDFSDYMFPVKGAIQKGAKGAIRHMAEKGPPKFTPGKGIKFVEESPMLNQSQVAAIASKGPLTQAAVKEGVEQVKTAGDITAKQLGKLPKSAPPKAIGEGGTKTNVADPTQAANKLGDALDTNTSDTYDKILDYARRNNLNVFDLLDDIDKKRKKTK